jgi:hypothetical protein
MTTEIMFNLFEQAFRGYGVTFEGGGLIISVTKIRRAQFYPHRL